MNLPFSALYLDLNLGEFGEDYAYQNKRYGGGSVVARSFLEKFDNFLIAGKPVCFENVRADKLNQCIVLTQSQIQFLRDGKPLKEVISNYNDFDIFVFHDCAIYLNLEGCKSQKQVSWPVGWCEIPNPKLERLIFFDLKIQQPRLQHNNHKIYHAVMGPVEPFQEYKKEDIMFVCGRQTRLHQSVSIAQMALKYQIQTYFARPVDKDCELLNYINNRETHYLGIIDQETKVKYNKISKALPQLQTWPVSATLAGKEAASFGVPLFTTRIGGWVGYIVEEKNGGFVDNEQDFINLWEKRDSFKQLDCYNAMLPHSESKMVESFSAAFEQIINEKNPS